MLGVGLSSAIGSTRPAKDTYSASDLNKLRARHNSNTKSKVSSSRVQKYTKRGLYAYDQYQTARQTLETLSGPNAGNFGAYNYGFQFYDRKHLQPGYYNNMFKKKYKAYATGGTRQSNRSYAYAGTKRRAGGYPPIIIYNHPRDHKDVKWSDYQTVSTQSINDQSKNAIGLEECLNIPQGLSGSDRVGQKIWIKSIYGRFSCHAATISQLDKLEFRMVIAIDHDCNKATFNFTDIYTGNEDMYE